jgi:4-amino-4-deoxy-L-arabinose transferase-like glycosyltransferase
MTARRMDLLALGIAIAAVLVSVAVGSRVFERLPHLEDEIAFLWEAEVMADGHITLPSPPQPRSFLVPFVVDYHGQRFGKYPPGWPATLALGARVGAPWLVNPLLAGLAGWLVYRLGSRLVSRGVGLLAEALTVTSPVFLMLAGSLMGHMLSLVLAAAFGLAWIVTFPAQPAEEASRRMLAKVLVALAGLSLGLLALTRPLTAVGVGLPAAVHSLWLIRRGGPARRNALLIFLLALAVASLLLLWQAALSGDPLLNPYVLWWDYDRLGFGPGHGHTASGHNLHWAWINTRHSLRAGLHDLFGWPFLSWICLPAGLWALRHNRDSWLLFGVFPALVGVYALYWIGSWLLGPRYYAESLPGLAIVSAAGIAWLAGWSHPAGRLARLRRWAVTAILLVLVAGNLIFYLPIRLGGLQGLYGISRSRLQSFEQIAPSRGLVIVHTRRAWTEYGVLLTLTRPFADSDLLLAYGRDPETNARLAESFHDLPLFDYYSDEPTQLVPQAPR